MFNDIYDRIKRQDSFSGIIVLACKRLNQYLSAKVLSGRQEKLRWFIQNLFYTIDPEVEITVQTGLLNGSQPWRGRKVSEHMNWDAPIRFGLWHKGKPIAGMAVEMTLFGIYIRQLQGVSKAAIPAELIAWPLVLTEGCMSFAREQGMSYVRLGLVDRTRHFESKNLRKRLIRRYDGTARKANMKMHPQFGEATFS